MCTIYGVAKALKTKPQVDEHEVVLHFIFACPTVEMQMKHQAMKEYTSKQKSKGKNNKMIKDH